jgi:hypothetical protein
MASITPNDKKAPALETTTMSGFAVVVEAPGSRIFQNAPIAKRTHNASDEYPDHERQEIDKRWRHSVKVQFSSTFSKAQKLEGFANWISSVDGSTQLE